MLPNSSAPSPTNTIIPDIDQKRTIGQEDDNDEDGPMEASGDDFGDEDEAGNDEGGENDKEDVEEDENPSKCSSTPTLAARALPITCRTIRTTTLFTPPYFL